MATSKKNVPNNPRIRSQIHEDQARRGIKPRKAEEKDTVCIGIMI